MNEDKIMKQIHQNQVQARKKTAKLSWQEEASLIAKIANLVAKKYKYKTLPVSDKPYALSSF